jgi:hypothetical protein
MNNSRKNIKDELGFIERKREGNHSGALVPFNF